MATANIKAVITAEDKASDVIKGVGDNINKNATKIGVGMAAVGAGFMALTKNSVDFTKELVSNTKALQRETGATAEQASGLLYVTNRLGVSAEQTSQTFGIFSKQIKAASEQTGLNTIEFQKLQNQIEKTKLEIKQTEAEIKKNGDTSGELTLKVKTLKTELFELEGQTKTSKDTFQKLGVEIKNTDGTTKDFNTVLLETADRFKTMPNGAEKTALAMELFGRSGKDLLPVLNLGSKGIQDLERNAEKLGLTLDQKNIGQVTRYIQAQKNLTDTTNSLKMQIGLLTTPILTAFTQKLADVANRVIQMDGPMQNLLAHVIAFGGPLLTAGGGLVTFGANIGTVLTSVKALGLGLSGIAAFLTGPLGLALVGATAIAGLLTFSFLNQTNQTQALKAAEDALKISQDNLSASQLALQGSTLAVEQAQKSYDESVRQFGPNSLEARTALNNLQIAQHQLKEAQDRTKQSQEDLRKKQQDVSKERALLDHLRELRGEIQGVGKDALDAGKKIDTLNGRQVTVKTSKDKNTGQETVDFVSTFGKAVGGEVRAGQGYTVGERGPEYFVPDNSGTIVPNNELGGSGGTVNINISAGAYMGSQQDARRYAKMIMDAYKDLMSAQGAVV